MTMDMLSIRHSLDDHVRSLGFNWHGGGTDLETGVMDLTFDHDGQDYKITLSEMNIKSMGDETKNGAEYGVVDTP